jgi:1-acyl-sn-glycerol-3-phosphate acyltransferase
VKTSALNNYPPGLVVGLARYITIAFSKIFWRIEYRQKENIPQNLKGGLLIVANHQTYLDPFWICAPIKRKLRFMAWDKAFNWFFIGWLIRYLGAFPINTRTGRSKSILRESLQSLKDGATLLIFPEGERAFSDGKLLEFKTGALRIALEAGVPILPVTVRGGNKIWAQDMKFPRPGKVEIIYHPLVELEPCPNEEDFHEYIRKQAVKIAGIIGTAL